MIRFTRLILFLGVAASLPAQSLSFGEITLTGTTEVVNVVLASNGAQVAGLQFDLVYDPTQLTVTIGLGSSATAAAKELSLTTLPAQYNPSTVSAADAGPGQRAIIIGAGLTDSSVPSTAGNLIADGVVATLTVTVASTATTTGQTLTLTNLAGTGPGAQNVAPAAVSLTGATLDLYKTYLVGNVYNSSSPNYPPSNESAPNFGTPGKLNLNDVLLILYVATNAPGYAVPPTCSDFFDAMNAYPYDTPTTRGGLAITSTTKINLNDVLAVLYYSTNAPGFKSWPIRTSLGGCPTGASMTANDRRPVALPVETAGAVILGPAQGAGTGQDRVPVYLQGGRDLSRLAFGFSVGDQQSQLQFEAAAEVPGLMGSSSTGVISAAWLQGLNVRAGQQLLLGYIVGPAGSAANLKVFGVSATGLSDNREVGFDVSGAPLVRQ